MQPPCTDTPNSRPAALTDSHCHLADPALRPQLDTLLRDSAALGVHRFIVPATRRSDFADVAELAAHPNIHIALGIHPWFAADAEHSDLQQLDHLLSTHPRALVGEIGLDFRQAADTAARQQQQTLLQQQLKLAKQHRRPIILHNLKATATLTGILKNTGFPHGGIAHAFSGSLEEAHSLIRCGLLIGIGSLLLHPNAKKARQAATTLPLEHIVLETDSPFMLPGQTNTPANLPHIAAIVAQLRGISTAAVAQQTETNLNRLLAFQTA